MIQETIVQFIERKSVQPLIATYAIDSHLKCAQCSMFLVFSNPLPPQKHCVVDVYAGVDH